jgi:hypothetical protein
MAKTHKDIAELEKLNIEGKAWYVSLSLSLSLSLWIYI